MSEKELLESILKNQIELLAKITIIAGILEDHDMLDIQVFEMEVAGLEQEIELKLRNPDCDSGIISMKDLIDKDP
ncbi:MAG: hypothetical protein WDA09_02220 [Bacteriovoracaceae bacterium]